MRSKGSLVLTLLAWLVATGSHWDLVQTFAWGRMIASYSRSMPLGEAVRLTFQPENLCGVCEVVAEAKATDPTAPAPAGQQEIKIVLGLAPAPAHALVPRDGARAWPRGNSAPLPFDREPPRLRPPRAV